MMRAVTNIFQLFFVSELIALRKIFIIIICKYANSYKESER